MPWKKELLAKEETGVWDGAEQEGMRCEPRESLNISWGLGELALTLSVAVPPGRMVPSSVCAWHPEQHSRCGVPSEHIHKDLDASIRSCCSKTSTLKQAREMDFRRSVWHFQVLFLSGFLGKQSQLDFFPAGGQSFAPHLFWWDFGKAGVEVGGVESTKTSESLLGCALPDPSAESCLFPGWQRHWWRKIGLLQVSEQTHDLVIEATY